MKTVRTLAILAALAAVLAPARPASAFLPYRAMLEAARSPEKPMDFAQDKMLRTRLRAALVAAEPGEALSVQPYVYLGHAFLVGYVDSPQERTRLVQAAQGVAGLRSIDVYLPPTPAGGTSTTASTELKLSVEKAITLDSSAHRMNVSVEVLGSHVVLLGAVANDSQIESVDQAARSVPGVTGITSYLLVPPPSQAKLLQGLLP